MRKRSGHLYMLVFVRNHGSLIVHKVMHPNIREDIDADLDIMRVIAKILPALDSTMGWLNPEGGVEEFAGMLKDQLDMRREEQNLAKFNKNFEEDDDIVFPKVRTLVVVNKLGTDSLRIFIS